MKLTYRHQGCRISLSEEYKSFRGSVPLKKISVSEDKVRTIQKFMIVVDLVDIEN